MKVLIIGSGGREHAIAYTIKKSKKVTEIHAIPGNPGIALIANCHDGNVNDFEFILNFVKNNRIDLTIIGPEVPLCLGLADLLEDNGFKVFGPRKFAATLEGSKAFAKKFMMKYNISTAEYKEVSNYDEALEALQLFKFPVVIKADGLAAGKGVVICYNENEAKKTLKEMLVEGIIENACDKVVIEEFLTGFECSLLCFTDGKTIIPMVSAKDHKQIYDGNKGPNTGGMGTISPNPFLSENMNEVIKKDVLDPLIKGLNAENIDYRGVIFIGLMIENNQAKVLEFNVRFGDPETQVILLRLKTDLIEIMEAVIEKRLGQIVIKWSDEYAGCLVLASKGYPEKYEKGKIITGLDELSKDVVIFHAGTSMNGKNIVTNGGRVLNICATGNTLSDVLCKIYNEAKVIQFDGKYYRNDIGLA